MRIWVLGFALLQPSLVSAGWTCSEIASKLAKTHVVLPSRYDIMKKNSPYYMELKKMAEKLNEVHKSDRDFMGAYLSQKGIEVGVRRFEAIEKYLKKYRFGVAGYAVKVNVVVEPIAVEALFAPPAPPQKFPTGGVILDTPPEVLRSLLGEREAAEYHKHFPKDESDKSPRAEDDVYEFPSELRRPGVYERGQTSLYEAMVIWNKNKNLIVPFQFGFKRNASAFDRTLEYLEKRKDVQIISSSSPGPWHPREETNAETRKAVQRLNSQPTWLMDGEGDVKVRNVIDNIGPRPGHIDFFLVNSEKIFQIMEKLKDDFDSISAGYPRD